MEAGTPRFRILRLIRLQGPLTTQAIAEALGVSKVAARGHLKSMERAGFVRSEERRGRVGRPAQTWDMTAKASREIFPDRHAFLAVELVQSIRECFGDEGVRSVLSMRATIQAKDTAEILKNSQWQERGRALAALRDRQGYMAEWTGEDDVAHLVLNHCPVQAASMECSEICELEEAAIREILGPNVDVRRLEHANSGARRCSYSISESAKPDSYPV